MALVRRAALALVLAGAAAAGEPAELARQDGIVIDDGHARAVGASARTAAAYMRIRNQGMADDRLVAVRSPAAERVELHTHVLQGGVARMRRVEGGVPVPAGETVLLESGGLHVMFLGLTAPFAPGGSVELTLIFEHGRRDHRRDSRRPRRRRRPRRPRNRPLRPLAAGQAPDRGSGPSGTLTLR